VKKAFFQIGEDVNNTIEWDRAVVTSGETDGWEIKRAGDQEVEVKIILFLEHSPSKVKLSPLLSTLLGMHTATRPRVLMSLWQYIKANKLLDVHGKKTILNDQNLKTIFGCETMQFADIPKQLRSHLSPPDPVELSYVIRLSGEPKEHAMTYELNVEVDDPATIQASVVYKKEIAKIEEQIAQVIQQVNERKRKRDFMLQFSNDPVIFLNKTVDTQIRDYKLMHAYKGRDPEEERKTSFFYQPYVEDAVQLHISKHNAMHQPQVRVNFNLPTNMQTTITTPPSALPQPIFPSQTPPQLAQNAPQTHNFSQNPQHYPQTPQ